jgi:CheY-like chemotaxis protein
MFDLFVQGPQTAERSIGGLGLGLTLVRTLMELHGGKVSAQSAGVGQGSTFTVALPLAVAAVDTSPPVKASSTTGPARDHTARKILVVDDNDDARMLLGEALETVGHQVRTAADAVEALEIVQVFTPDVAVLDIGLPVMDGYELAGRLRAQLGAKAPRLIALTGYGQENDRARSAEAGFDLHLVKPIDVKRLLVNIDELGEPPT